MKSFAKSLQKNFFCKIPEVILPVYVGDVCLQHSLVGSYHRRQPCNVHAQTTEFSALTLHAAAQRPAGLLVCATSQCSYLTIKLLLYLIKNPLL